MMRDGAGAIRRRFKSMRKFIHFLLVGGLNTAIGYGLYAGFVLLGLRPELALALATGIGIVVNFATTGRLVFGNRDRSRFFRFVAVYAVIYAGNVSVLRLLIDSGVAAIPAQLICLPAVAVLTFLAMQAWVFQENRR